MKRVTYGLVLLVLSISGASLALSTFARDALAQAPAEMAPSEHKGTFMRPHGVIGITETCGCEAECPKDFNPSEASSCLNAGGKCIVDQECTLTCKKGKEEKKVTGKCKHVYR